MNCHAQPSKNPQRIEWGLATREEYVAALGG
jgi:hypothetical protein